MPWLLTRPDSGTAACDHELLELCHGPHVASVCARKQPVNVPAGTFAFSCGNPCQLMTSVESAPWYVLRRSESIGPSRFWTLPFLSFMETARMSIVFGSARFGI